MVPFDIMLKRLTLRAEFVGSERSGCQIRRPVSRKKSKKGANSSQAQKIQATLSKKSFFLGLFCADLPQLTDQSCDEEYSWKAGKKRVRVKTSQKLCLNKCS